MNFDIFTIRQWREGYTLEVKIARPRNAPRHKHTEADMKRIIAASRKDQELASRMFGSLEEVFEEIKRLQFPLLETESQ